MISVAVLAAVAVVIFWLIVPPTQGFVPPRARHNSVADPEAEFAGRDSTTDSHQGAHRTLAALWLNLRNRRLPVLYAQAFLLMGGFVATYNYLGYRLERPPFEIPVAVTALLILTGLLVMTAGFFGAHFIASGWVGARAQAGRARATSLYNLYYYGGSSLFGWLGGPAFLTGWIGTALMVAALAGCALLVAAFSARER